MADEVAKAPTNSGKSVVPGKNTGDLSWLNENLAVIIGILSVAVVAMRLLSVARGDPETAYAILQIGGTANVLVATLVSTLGLLAMPAALILGYLWFTHRDSKESELHLLAAISIGTLYVSLYMSPFLLGLYSALFLLIVLSVHHAKSTNAKALATAVPASDPVRAVDQPGLAVGPGGDQRAQRHPRVVAAVSRKSRTIITVSIAALILGIFALEFSSPTPWLPEQAIFVAGQEQGPFSGYVLAQADGQTSILTANPEGVITIPSQSILSTEQCTPHRYLWEQATLFDLVERSLHKLRTYPACHPLPTVKSALVGIHNFAGAVGKPGRICHETRIRD